MLHVTENLDMREGDMLVTSGLGGRFPPGYPVGKIEKITKEQSTPFLNVVASPVAGINSRRHLLVVTKNVS
jgi:rod shape-determining protein MreC